MRIVDPIGSSTASARALAARPRSLEGVTIALLDNSKPNARVLLDRVGALLVISFMLVFMRASFDGGAAEGYEVL